MNKGLKKWLEKYSMIDYDRDHWCATGKDLERLWRDATTAEQERCIERCRALQQKYRNKERRYIVQRCIDYMEVNDD